MESNESTPGMLVKELAMTLAVLDVDPTDVDEVPSVGVVMGDELGHHGHWLLGVHHEVALGPGSEEGLVSNPPAVEVATVLVADSVIPLVRGVVYGHWLL